MSFSTGSMGVGVMAILSGLVGAYGLRAVLWSEEAPPEQSRYYEVPLATADLPEYRTIMLGDVGLLRMSATEMRERGIESVMMDPQQIIGRTLRKPMRQGSPFKTTDFYLEGGEPDIREMLTEGMVAVPLKIPADRGGNVVRGAKVNVLFRTTPEKDSEIPEVSMVLMEAVTVLSVKYPKPQQRSTGLDVRRWANQPVDMTPTVIVAVEPEQAQQLHVVNGKGELSLVLRSMADDAVTSGRKADKMTLAKVLGLEDEPPQKYLVTEHYYRGQMIPRYFNYDESRLAQQQAMAQAQGQAGLQQQQSALMQQQQYQRRQAALGLTPAGSGGAPQPPQQQQPLSAIYGGN